MKFLFILSIIQVVSAFRSFSPRIVSRNVFNAVEAMQIPTAEKSGLQELIQMILEALPLAINTPPPDMDKEKLINNPPRFYKAL